MSEIKVIRRKEAQRYVLIDLNRTLSIKAPVYWKSNRSGYTPTITQAGIYRLSEAREISLNDVKGLTVMLPIDEALIKHIEHTRENLVNYED